MRWYWQVLRNYANFRGRARRKEYWMFYLFSSLIGIVLGLTEGIAAELAGISESNIYDVLPSGVLGTLYTLGILLPSLAVAVRRAHDSNHRGWWLLVPILNFVLLVRKGEAGANRFGPDPKPENREKYEAAA